MTTARRVNRGRGHSYTLEGKPLAGVTTVIGKSLPKDALPRWAAREAADAVVAKRDLLADPRFSDQELYDIIQGAPFRERDKAANRGTEVHRLAEKLAHGEEVDVPDELAGHVDAYVAFLDTFQPADALVELSVFNRTYRYAGTADLLCNIDRRLLGLTEQPTAGPARCLLDVKTNRSGPFGETALQLGAYGHAEFYIGPTGDELPMPSVDFYGVIWVRADGYDLYPYDVTEVEWRQFLRCLGTAWWVDQRRDHVKKDAIWVRQEVTK